MAVGTSMLIASIIGAVGSITSGGIQLGSNRRAREEAQELAQIQRRDMLETERMNQDLTKIGQGITQDGIDHNSMMATNEINLMEDQASESEGALNRSMLSASSDHRSNELFGNVQAKQNRIARRGQPTSSMFGRQ